MTSLTVKNELIDLNSGRYSDRFQIIIPTTKTYLNLKNWLILEQTSQTDSIPISDTTNHSNRLSLKSKVALAISLFVIGYPLLTSAGVFESTPLKMIFSEKKSELTSSINTQEQNSQTAHILQAAINFDPNASIGGADLNIIEDKALVAESGVVGGFVEITQRSNDTISVYKVKEGDTLSQIAHMFDVSVNTIKWANNLEGAVQPGDSLVILPISGIKHTVKSGGTIKDIAEIYKADTKEIALFNGISVDTPLSAGQEIIVPNVDLVVESKPKPTPKKSSSSSITRSASQAVSSSSNWLTNPVPGAVRSQGIHGYNAVDLAAPTGTPMYAAAGGTVIIAKSGGGWNGGYGNYVVIKHSNGTQTLYAHMSSVYVTSGQSVSQGTQIGTVGNTGRSTGSHVHFEVRGAKNPF